MESRKEVKKNNYTTVKKIVGLVMVIATLFMIKSFIDVENMFKKRDTIQKKKIERLKFNENKKLKELSKKINGDDFKFLNANLISTDNKRDYTELTYEVDLLPTNFEKLDNFIPKELLEKYKNASRKYNLKFVDKNNKSAMINYSCNIEFSEITEKLFVEPLLYKEKKGEKNKLTFKSIRKTNYPLMGKFLSFRSSNPSQTTNNQEFTIGFKNSNYVIKQNNKADIIFNKFELSDFTSSEKINKFKSIVAILNSPNNKYLTERAVYAIKDIATYRGGEIEKSKAYLKYKFTSETDMTAVCELVGSDYNVKYFADHKTGIIRGMQMGLMVNNYQVNRVTLWKK